MSSEDFEGLKALKAARKELRRRYAVACPICVAKLPKAHPAMLLPEERCKLHGYKDPRPRIGKKEVDEIFESFGLHRR